MGHKYLLIIDKNTGKRETSFVVGTTGPTYEDLEEKAANDYPNGYLFIRDDGTLQAQLTNQNTFYLNNKVETQPSEVHEWNGSEWVVNQQKQAELLRNKRQQYIDSVDNTASQIYSKWTRFSEEYFSREAAAKEFVDSNYQTEASIWITSFAQAAGIDNKTAANIILQQATSLRQKQETLGALRMRKYDLNKPNLTIQEMQSIYDDIVNKMKLLEE